MQHNATFRETLPPKMVSELEALEEAPKAPTEEAPGEGSQMSIDEESRRSLPAGVA